MWEKMSFQLPFFFFLIILIVLASNTARHVNYIPCTCETFCCGCSRSPSTFCLLPLPADDRWLVSRSCVTVEAAHLQSIYLLMTALHHLPSLPHMRVALCGECPSGAFHFSGELNYKLWKLQYEKKQKQTTCSSRVLPLLDLPEESQLIRDDQATWGSVSFVCVCACVCLQTQHFTSLWTSYNQKFLRVC